MNPLLIVLLLLLASPAWAACLGSSPNLTAATWADVAACHTAASNGDTITYTGGNTTVTSGPTSFTKHVILNLSGATITDNVSAGATMIAVTESTVGSTTIKNGTVVAQVDHDSPDATISWAYATNGFPIIVRDMVYQSGSISTNFIFSSSGRGIVYNVTGSATPLGTNCNNTASLIRIVPGTSVPRPDAWESPPVYGSADASGNRKVYLDKLTLTNMGEGIDLANDARAVVRFSTFTNYGITLHGDSDAGARYLEYYKNTFIYDTSAQTTCSPTSLPVNAGAAIGWRAGTGIVVDNVAPSRDFSPSWGMKHPFAMGVWTLRRNGMCWIGGYPAPRQAGWGYSTGATTLVGTGNCDDGGPSPNCASGMGLEYAFPMGTDLEPIIFAGNTGGGNYGEGSAPIVTDYNCNSGDACDTPSVATCEARASALTYAISDREFYQQASSFNGTTGTGSGVRTSRPSTCTIGTAWWSTDQDSWNASGAGGQGVLDKCTATNTWTNAAYTPYTYPHPLTLSAAPVTTIPGGWTIRPGTIVK